MERPEPCDAVKDATCRVAIFGPNPVLNVTIEARPSGGDDIHLHPAGQGVWVARTAGELGAQPILCGFVGGEPGALLRPLLDRRGGVRDVVAGAWSGPPSRHELDDLFSLTCTAALSSGALAVCNPWPGDRLPLELYGNLVSDARANGVPVLIDLSTPRLDSALEGRPDVVKINDWELAEYVSGPVDGPRLRAGAECLLERGAAMAVITRGGEPALAVGGDRAWEIVPPRLERGFREGCGDSMLGAMACALATGLGAERMLVLGAARAPPASCGTGWGARGAP
jgi:1-phosphofructokinase